MGNQSTVGIYVDVANIAMNGGYGMRFDVLRDFASHDNGEVVRLNAYAVYDDERARDDLQYNTGIHNFFSTLRDFGYKVIQKNVKKYKDEEGVTYAKANSDLDMAVDLLLQSEKLDKVVLLTGDGDFVQVVRALQNKGCRVELVAFVNVSADLRREVDMFVSGYLVPNLLPVKNNSGVWGELNSRVRGYCYDYKHDRGFGFMRFLKQARGDLWITDTRHPLSPYENVFFHASSLLDHFDTAQLPSRSIFFEFDIVQSSKKEGFEAKNISTIATL